MKLKVLESLYWEYIISALRPYFCDGIQFVVLEINYTMELTQFMF